MDVLCRYLIALRPYASVLVLVTEVALSLAECAVLVCALLHGMGVNGLAPPLSTVATLTLLLEVGNVRCHHIQTSPNTKRHVCCHLVGDAF